MPKKLDWDKMATCYSLGLHPDYNLVKEFKAKGRELPKQEVRIELHNPTPFFLPQKKKAMYWVVRFGGHSAIWKNLNHAIIERDCKGAEHKRCFGCKTKEEAHELFLAWKATAD